MIQLILKFNCKFWIKTSGNYNFKELSLKADGISISKIGEKEISTRLRKLKKGFVFKCL